MKATMDNQGVITLAAESSVEAYALTRWADESFVLIYDEKLMESGFVRGSRLIVSTAWPPYIEPMPQPTEWRK